MNRCIQTDIIRKNVDRLKDMGVIFLEPSVEEGKAKIAEPELVLQSVMRELNEKHTSFSLEGKNILVTAGSTVEHIDPIRVITNLSSGKMGIAIAEGALLAGAKVTLVYGHGSDGTRVPIKISKCNQSKHKQRNGDDYLVGNIFKEI